MIESKQVFIILIVLLFLSVITAGSVFSQAPAGGAGQTQMDQPGPQGQQEQQGQQGQGFGQRQMQDPEQMQAMITSSLKELLGSTDEEWEIIGPKVLNVYSLTMASSQSRGFNMRTLMGGNTGRGSMQGNTQGRGMDNRSMNTTGGTALEELQTLLESEDTTTSQLRNKMAEVRKERETAIQDLAKAQKELRELLTLKQEAILISIGMLE